MVWLGIYLISCGSDDEVPDTSKVTVDFKVRRLERELLDLKSKADILQYLNENPKLSQQFFRRDNYPNDSVLVDQIYQFVSFEFNDTLIMDIDKVYGDFREVTQEFEQAFKYLKYYYPETKTPDVYTIASGFGSFGWGSDLFMGSDFVIIGLDYFAGETATYHPNPSDVPGYMLRRYEKEYIVPNIMKLMSQRHIKSDFLDQTLIADMIFYGKAICFTKKMLPYTSDTLIMGYTGEDLANAHYNEQEIFTHFVKNQLLFETGATLKQKYVGERPQVTEIADACPGRIGRWLGWQIIQQYMQKNEEVTFQEMLLDEQAKKIFQESGYQPTPRESQ